MSKRFTAAMFIVLGIFMNILTMIQLQHISYIRGVTDGLKACVPSSAQSSEGK